MFTFSEACSGKLKKVPLSLSSVCLSLWFCLFPVVWDCRAGGGEERVACRWGPADGPDEGFLNLAYFPQVEAILELEASGSGQHHIE